MLSGASVVKASSPELLREAFKNWSEGKDDLSFVQRTRYLNDDGSLKEERVERYDPSLPDKQRWALLEVNGKRPTPAEIERIQDRRNKKPRKKANKALEEYFDLENAKVVETEKESVRYDVAVKPEAARLISVDKLSVGISIRKDTKTIDRITAGLSEPLRIALGVAKVTDLDLDLRFDADDDHAEKKTPAEAASEADGTARVVMSKLGNRAEYTWGEFKRVSRYQGGGKSSSVGGQPGAAVAAAKTDK
ncbi:hypothetical protein [Nibricoccus aquaticus]|nr:hypothetical protein [Nibricoccus aquaticus]